ncbi:MAG TPA: serine/threonine-protein kinase [Steroidobacteraceae bacterium]|nr:serine/threonine-protein kinase [Steroidobacteraceae bacterium]
MTPELWLRVKDVFSAASALGEPQRTQYLNEACGDDAQLRAEVDSLLAAHNQADAVVDRPAAAYVSGAPWLGTDHRIGQRVGAYEIVALIGHGGMGEVYRARRVDAEYDKEVAIKLVPAGYHRDFVLQRVRAERQILANLDHPDIARLIDGGATDDGLPYLVMELVEGEPLDRYCEQHNLSVRARLQLFRDVCAAVSYAHQRLVVHRDLKPSNILVTADGRVKLLDFGIAKLLQPTASESVAAPTVTLMQALTPGFASPEQILGETITTASDVYSLGVLLYLLLTGRSPYRTSLDSAHDVIREVCETDAAPPSVHATLDRDLDAITLRALRKEPDKRYRSVDLLSEDIGRHLEGLPVQARGDQFSYRAWKFVRRHKLQIAAAAILAVTLLGGVLASLREARIAEQQRVLAEQQRERAERHFSSVRKLADTFVFQVHDAIKELPGSTAARQLLVTTALEYLNTLAAEAGNDRQLQQDLAAAYEKVGDIQGQAYGPANVGEPRLALDSYAKGIALLEGVVADDPGNVSARSSLARSYLRRSRLLLLLGDSAKAVVASQSAVTAFETLAQMQPDVATRAGLADAYSSHAYTMDMAGDMPGGQGDAGNVYARKAVATLESLTQQNPDDVDLAYKLAKAYSTLAITVLGDVPRPETMQESLDFHRKALAVDARLVASTEGANSKYARALLLDRMNVAFILNEMADYRGAVENARAAQPLLSRLRTDANNTQVRVDSANLAWPLGRALLALGEVNEAAKVFEQHAAVLAELAAESDTLKVQYLRGTMAYGLAEVHSRLASSGAADPSGRLKHLRQASALYAEALAHFERVTASVTLDHMDRHPVEGAVAGLARSKAEIAKLERS